MSYQLSFSELRSTHAQAGRLEWIGLRPAYDAPMVIVQEVEAIEGHGLLGDRAGKTYGSKRQVTLIQAEHMPVISALAGLMSVDPSSMRRNLVVSGINLVALKDREFHIGEVILKGTGYCHPCSKMERTLGAGGYNAMRGHGGLNAMVLKSGCLRKGDIVNVLPDANM